MNENEFYNETIEVTNPFFSSLKNPRETIRYVYENNITKYNFLLLYLYGLDYVLVTSSRRDYNIDIIYIGLILIMAPISGWITVALNGFLYALFGRMFGGVADSKDMRAAILWSNTPNMILLPVTLLSFILGSNNVIEVTNNGGIYMLVILCSLVTTVCSIWCYINLLRMISELQDFSVGKAFLSTLIPGVILAVMVVLIIIAVFLAVR